MPEKKSLKETDIKYSSPLLERLNDMGDPTYIVDLDGRHIPTDSSAMAGAFADFTVNAILLKNDSYSMWRKLEAIEPPLPESLILKAKITYLQMEAQVARYFTFLADSVDHFKMPLKLQGPKMARHNVTLDSITETDSVYNSEGDEVEYQTGTVLAFNSTNDWRDYALKINSMLAEFNKNSPQIDQIGMSSSYGMGRTSGMGLLPLAAIPTIAWVVMGVTFAVTVIGVYSVSKYASWWTEHDKTEQLIVQDRLKCYDLYAKQWIEEQDAAKRERLKTVMDDCQKQAEDHTSDDAGPMALLKYGVTAAVVLLGITYFLKKRDSLT